MIHQKLDSTQFFSLVYGSCFGYSEFQFGFGPICLLVSTIQKMAYINMLKSVPVLQYGDTFILRQ